ncbi:hypothetical protein ACFW15_29625, partial [Streptomyces sp. NPDC058953]
EGSQLVAIALANAPVDGPDTRWLDGSAGPRGHAPQLAARGGPARAPPPRRPPTRWRGRPAGSRRTVRPPSGGRTRRCRAS